MRDPLTGGCKLFCLRLSAIAITHASHGIPLTLKWRLPSEQRHFLSLCLLQSWKRCHLPHITQWIFPPINISTPLSSNAQFYLEMRKVFLYFIQGFLFIYCQVREGRQGCSFRFNIKWASYYKMGAERWIYVISNELPLVCTINGHRTFPETYNLRCLYSVVIFLKILNCAANFHWNKMSPLK